MRERRPHLYLTSGFRVDIENHTYGFTSVRNISEAIEVETVREGGNNWYVYNLVKPTSASNKLILENGFMAWQDYQSDHGLQVGKRLDNVSIMVIEHKHIVRTYTFKRGIVTRWEISDFDASQNQIIINKVEILHSGLRLF